MNLVYLFWVGDEGYPEDQMIGHNNTYIIGKNKGYHSALEIHWFEFTLLYLCPRLPKYLFRHWTAEESVDNLQYIACMKKGIDILYFYFKNGYIK